MATSGNRLMKTGLTSPPSPLLPLPVRWPVYLLLLLLPLLSELSV